MGSTSSILAALMRVCNLSAYVQSVTYPAIISTNPQGPVGGVSYSDLDTVIGEDQSRVGGCELGVRHCEDL